MIRFSTTAARGVLIVAILLLAGTVAMAETPVELEDSSIYIEYNSTDNDLGFHVLLDGEDWKLMTVTNPNGKTIFRVDGQGPYKDLGLTELFFEGAEPTLGVGEDEVPLEDLLELFPEGEYTFDGFTVEGGVKIVGAGTLTYDVPAGPVVDADLSGSELVISWLPVTDDPGFPFPDRTITIDGYQVIVESFQVTLPADATSVTVPPEFVDSLDGGECYDYEVLAIEVGGNQTITSDEFCKP